MRYFAYNELGENGVEVVVVSRQRILRDYYPYWIERIKDKYGDAADNFTEEDCLED
jgi:hypothetical protein